MIKTGTRILILIVICLGFVASSKAQTPPVCTFAQVAFNSVNNTFEYHCPNTNNWYLATVNGGGGGGGGNGLLDPGANGIVLRTALNITTIASSTDIIALFGGICNSTTFLRADGTCASSSITYPAAGIAVSAGISGPWNPSLQVGTNPNNLIQLNGAGQLPAVSAANLINFPVLNQNTTGNAATATALSATPSLCVNGQAPRGILTNGNSTGCQVIGLSASSAQKPDVSTALMYIAVNCTGGIPCVDTNDGQSWGTAKATVYNGACSLPTGNCSTQTAGSGSIYIGPGSISNPIAGDGLWMMGASDPNFSSPPAGWLKCNNCAIHFDGSPNAVSNPNGSFPTARLLGGSNTDRNKPGLWLSGTYSNRFSNLAFDTAAVGIGRPIVLGECSDHTRANCGVNGVSFDYDTGYTTQGGVFGPCIDISSNSYWMFFDHIGCTGNSGGTNGFSASNAAAFLIDGSGNNGSGLITIDHCNFDDGGLKFIPGADGGGFSIKNCTEESSGVSIPPVAWMTSFPSATSAYVENLSISDNPNGVATFENDDATNGARGLPIVLNTNNIQGPAVVTNSTSLSPTISPLVAQHLGPSPSTTPQRLAGLASSRFTNAAYTNNALWTQSGGSVTITPGVSDPFGGTGAATLSSVAGGSVNLSGVNTIGSGGVGSWVVFGAWLQNGGWTPNASGFLIQGCPGSGDFFPLSATYSNGGGGPTDGQWQWIWFAHKNNSASGNQCTSIQVNPGVSGNVYAPVSFYIPSGTLTDNEVLEFAWTMGSIDFSAPVGSIANVSGHPLNVDVINTRDPVSLGTLETRATAACEVNYGITTAHTGSATITTGANCLPANSVIEAVLYRITTTLSGNAISSFTVGDGTVAGRFCGTQSTLTAGTTGICFAQTDQTGTSGPKQASAAPVVVTENQIATAGAIRLLVYYHTWTPPTN